MPSIHILNVRRWDQFTPGKNGSHTALYKKMFFVHIPGDIHSFYTLQGKVYAFSSLQTVPSIDTSGVPGNLPVTNNLKCSGHGEVRLLPLSIMGLDCVPYVSSCAQYAPSLTPHTFSSNCVIAFQSTTRCDSFGKTENYNLLNLYTLIMMRLNSNISIHYRILSATFAAAATRFGSQTSASAFLSPLDHVFHHMALAFPHLTQDGFLLVSNKYSQITMQTAPMVVVHDK